MKPVNINNTTFLIGLALFLASFVFYLMNLFHLSSRFFATNYGPFFGADTRDIANNMRVPPAHGYAKAPVILGGDRVPG